MTTSNKILVIDTETGGLDPLKHSLLSVSGVHLDLENKSIKPLFDILIKEPKLIVDKEAIKINNIDLNRVITEGLEPSVAAKQILETLKDDGFEKPVALAGHNVGFDISFLKRMFYMTKYDFNSYFSYRSIDTLSIMRFLQEGGIISKEGSNLDFLANSIGIEYDASKRHTSATDALITATALLSLIERIRS